jgi:hypothetical protein
MPDLLLTDTGADRHVADQLADHFADRPPPLLTNLLTNLLTSLLTDTKVADQLCCAGRASPHRLQALKPPLHLGSAYVDTCRDILFVRCR